MLPSEMARVLLFLGVVVAVYLAAAGIVVQAGLGRGRKQGEAEPTSRSQVWFRRVVLGLAASGILCFAYGYWIEPHWLEVTRVRIESAKLTSAVRPIRLVHISDLHSDSRPRLEARLPGVIEAEKPDLIVFTGDATSSPAGIPVFQECLRRLARIAPTFVVKGNWDYASWENHELESLTGARELDAEAAQVEVAGVALWVVGLPFGYESQLEKALAPVPPGAFTIFLFHPPDAIDEVSRRGIDLYCAGHTHGGQVALPFYGALVTLSKFGKKYEAGLYRVGNTWLNVNRGIGTEGGPAPRVRFWARPEVTVIELVGSRSSRPSRQGS